MKHAANLNQAKAIIAASERCAIINLLSHLYHDCWGDKTSFAAVRAVDNKDTFALGSVLDCTVLAAFGPSCSSDPCSIHSPSERVPSLWARV